MDLINFLTLGIPRRYQLGKLARLFAHARHSVSGGRRMQGIIEYDECLDIARALERWDLVRYLRMMLAGLYVEQHDHTKARLHYTEAVNVARSLKDLPSLAHARCALASVVGMMGDYTLAERLCEEAHEFFHTSDDSIGLASVCMVRADMAQTTTDARKHYSDALALYEKAQSRIGVLGALLSLGHLAEPGRDNTNERLSLTRCLTMCDEEHDVRTQAYALNNLANIDRFDGNLHSAATRYNQSLKLKQQLDDEWAISYTLDGCANLAACWGEVQKAAQLYGAADAIRMRLGTPLERSRLSLYSEEVNATRRSLGEEPFEIWWRVGTQMSVDDAVELALGLVGPGE